MGRRKGKTPPPAEPDRSGQPQVIPMDAPHSDEYVRRLREAEARWPERLQQMQQDRHDDGEDAADDETQRDNTDTE